MPLVMDKYGKAIKSAHSILKAMSCDETLVVNRHYMSTDTISVNFRLMGKRYLLVIGIHDKKMEIWHSTKNNLIKRKFKRKQIVNREFLV